MALALKQNMESSSGQARCPSCGANLGPEAVICLQCGYDTRTGRRVDDEAAPRHNPLVIAGVALLVAVAAGLVAYRLLGNGSSSPPLAPPLISPSASALPAVVSPTESVEPAMASAPVDMAPTPEPAVPSDPPESTPPVAPVESNVVNIVPAPDPLALEAEARPAVEAQLDKVAPLFVEGEEVELRLTNGVVQRGIFRARTTGGLHLSIGTNETRTLDYAMLDRASRVRSDPAFRTRYIEHHVKQRVQKMLNAPAPEGSD